MYARRERVEKRCFLCSVSFFKGENGRKRVNYTIRCRIMLFFFFSRHRKPNSNEAAGGFAASQFLIAARERPQGRLGVAVMRLPDETREKKKKRRSATTRFDAVLLLFLSCIEKKEKKLFFFVCEAAFSS